MKHGFSFYEKTRGISLIEILIALLVTNILYLTVATFWSAQRKTVMNETKKTQQLEKEQLVMHLLGKPLRMAGYVGCRTLYDQTIVNGTEDTTPIKGFSKNTAPFHIKVKATNTSDILFIRTASFPAATLLKAAQQYDDEVLTAKLDVSVGERIVISDCSTAEVAVVRAIRKKDVGTVLQLTQALTGSYLAHSMISTLNENYFYLGETKRKDEKGKSVISLYKHAATGQAHELIEGIAALNFTFSTEKAGIPRYVQADRIKDWLDVNKVKIQIQTERGLFSTEIALRNAQ